MAAGERQHEAGREGIRAAKWWLESTTRFAVPWDVYGAPQQTTVPLLGGTVKGFDIAGYLVGEDGKAGPHFYGEVKNYRIVGDQPEAYSDYLAVCYSAMCQAMVADLDPATEFMWVTWHPFSQGKFLGLRSADEIEAACLTHPQRLAGATFDRDIAETLSERLWLLLMNERQPEMTMSRAFLGEVRRLITMRTTG